MIVAFEVFVSGKNWSRCERYFRLRVRYEGILEDL